MPLFQKPVYEWNSEYGQFADNQSWRIPKISRDRPLRNKNTKKVTTMTKAISSAESDFGCEVSREQPL